MIRPAVARGLALGAVAALALPFLVPGPPLMDDYPAHLARYDVIARIGHDPLLQRAYRIDWRLTGNLGGELIVLPLARVIGLAAAGKLLAAAIPLLTGLGVLAVARARRGDVRGGAPGRNGPLGLNGAGGWAGNWAGPGALLALLMVWSPALRMGFLNWTLALALALLVFAAWLRRWRTADPPGAPPTARSQGGRSQGARSQAGFVAAGLGVWLCHVSGWGVLGLLVLGAEWHRRRHAGRALLATWPLWAPAGVMALTALAGGPAGGGLAGGFGAAGFAAGLGGDWGSLSYKTAILVQALRGDWRLLDILCLGLVLAALAEARGRGALDGALLRPALLLLGAALVMPRHLGGGDFADARLVPVALMIAALAIDGPLTVPRAALALGPLALRLGLLTATWGAQGAELARLLAALDHVPPGARIASAVVRDTGAWPTYPFSHVGAWATLRRDARVNAHFAIPGVHLLQLRADGPGPAYADPSQEIAWRAGETVDLRRFAPAAGADYLWYVGPVGAAPAPAVRLPPGAVVIEATGPALLARLPAPPR